MHLLTVEKHNDDNSLSMSMTHYL